MAKLYNFLVEHAKFPFPHTGELRTAGTTDISDFEVGLLERDWKAEHAVRDETLVQKLCHTLKNILGDTPLAADAENYLLASFSPNIQFDERGREDRAWSRNPNEAHVSFSKNSGSSFEAERFGLTLGAESVVARQGVLRRRGQVLVGIWSIYL
jgi:hypothetical protein